MSHLTGRSGSQNWWSRYCTDMYRQIRQQQDARCEEWSLGYSADASIYYDKVEPKVSFRDVLLRLRGTADHLPRN